MKLNYSYSILRPLNELIPYFIASIAHSASKYLEMACNDLRFSAMSR